VIVTGVRSTPEYRRYRADADLKRAVDAAHYAQCGCENWVGCCLLRPGFLEQAVRDFAEPT
jgi:hypothetical protein